MNFAPPVYRIRDFNENQLFDLGEKAGGILAGLPPDELLGELAASLGELTQELGAKIGRVDANPETEAKREADQLRDRYKVRLWEMVAIARDDPESEAIRAAAEGVQAVLDRRPSGFQNYAYAENSSELKALFADLDEPAVAAAVTQAGLGKWVEALRQAQADFAAIDARHDEFARTQPRARALEEIRRDFNEMLRLLFGNLAWLANRRGPQSDAANRFRGLREELVALRSVARTRQTRREGAGEPAVLDA